MNASLRNRLDKLEIYLAPVVEDTIMFVSFVAPGDQTVECVATSAECDGLQFNRGPGESQRAFRARIDAETAHSHPPPNKRLVLLFNEPSSNTH